MDNCRFCFLIEELKSGANQSLVAELKTGYVIIGRNQLAHGYTLFISKVHARELHELEDRDLFLHEMGVVAEAVFKAFQPIKLNYELMGNSIDHAHWHLIPRHADDLNLHGPFWCIEKSVRESFDTIPSGDQMAELKTKLLLELQKLEVAFS